VWTPSPREFPTWSTTNVFTRVRSGPVTRRRRSRIVGAAALLTLAAACGSGDDDTTVTTPDQSGYCEQLGSLLGVLDGGGTVAEYNALLTRVVAGSPAGHTDAWARLLTLSEEPFSYDNFNSAVDTLERIEPEFEVTCPGLARLIVDDDGRVRSFPTS
jgi:hypothetical protein